MKMKLLPREDWEVQAMEGVVIASIFEHPSGCVYHKKYQASELPNDLIGEDELERFGIDLIDGLAVSRNVADRTGHAGTAPA